MHMNKICELAEKLIYNHSMNNEEKETLIKYEKLFNQFIDDEAYYGRPKRYDDLYCRIENIADYEYTYVLAYELSQKNAKVKKLFLDAELYRKNSEKYEKNIFDFYNDSINLGYGSFLEEVIDKPKSDSFFEISNTNLTLDDVLNFDIDLEVEHIGLWKLIAYLIDTKNLYKRTNKIYEDKQNNLIYESCELMNINEAEQEINNIMSNPSEYAAHCKNKYTNKKELTVLSKDMPLEILDEAFLQDLTMTRIKNKNSIATINYSVPTLTFKDETVVNFPINLNLDVEELKLYITKIKNDFDNKKGITKSPLEIFGEELKKAKKPNSANILPSKTTKENTSFKPKWKRAVADALYIYDLYKYIEKIFVDKKKKYTQDSILIEVAFASGISKKHNNILEDSVDKKSVWGKNSIQEKYYKLMREYIENEKYKELITGVKVNKIPGMWDRIPTSPIFSITIDELMKRRNT